MEILKYTLLICCAAILRISLRNDEFLSTPYIIKSILILLLIVAGIIMIVRDLKKKRT